MRKNSPHPVPPTFADPLSRSWRPARATRRALAACVGLAMIGVPAAAAHAGPLTALARCQAGTAPDTTQTVWQPGNATASFPSGTNPDNAIFPGDVVTVTVTGVVNYDGIHTTGPGGIGTPDSNGIRPYASTTTFNNLPGGWVGPSRPTTSLRSCTAAPGAPVRAIYLINDPNPADNTGGFTITTRVWHAPGRIVIDGAEVTQGIQNAQGQVPLVAGKRTFVRVYLHNLLDASGPMTGVTANLAVDGFAPVAPIVYRSITTSTTGSNPRVLTNSFLFELPSAALAEGTRNMTVTVVPPAGRAGGYPVVRHQQLTFGPTAALTIYGIRTSYYNVPAAMQAALSATQPGLTVQSGWWRARQVADWTPLRRRAEDMLPVAHLTVNDTAPTSVWGTASFDCRAFHDPTTGAWSCAGYQDATNWETGYVDSLCPGGGCTAMLLQPEIDDGENGTDWGSPAGNSINNMQGERNPQWQGDTLAHELGHRLGLGHTPNVGNDVDPLYPRADGSLGPFVALEYAPSIQLVPGLSGTGAVTAWDQMNYVLGPKWFAPYNFCKAMANVPGTHPTCPPGLNG